MTGAISTSEPELLLGFAREAVEAQFGAVVAAGVTASNASTEGQWYLTCPNTAVVKVCAEALDRAGYLVEPESANVMRFNLLAYLAPDDTQRMLVEAPLRLSEGPDRPTRLTDAELAELRARAQAGAGGPVNSRFLAAPKHFHSIEWAQAVVGFRTFNYLSDRVTFLLLELAMEAEPEPPETPAQAVARLEAEEATCTAPERQRALREERERKESARRKEWEEDLEACEVEVSVRPNRNGRRIVRDGQTYAVMTHAVPVVAARSQSRRHPAGRALCEVNRERAFGDPVDEPVLCQACRRYMRELHAETPTH